MPYVLDGPMRGQFVAIPDGKGLRAPALDASIMTVFGKELSARVGFNSVQYQRVKFSELIMGESMKPMTKGVKKTWEFLTVDPDKMDHRHAESLCRELPPSRIEDEVWVWGPMTTDERRVLRVLCLMQKYRGAGRPFSKKVKRFDWRYREQELFRLQVRGYIQWPRLPTKKGMNANENHPNH